MTLSDKSELLCKITEVDKTTGNAFWLADVREAVRELKELVPQTNNPDTPHSNVLTMIFHRTIDKIFGEKLV